MLEARGGKGSADREQDGGTGKRARIISKKRQRLFLRPYGDLRLQPGRSGDTSGEARRAATDRPSRRRRRSTNVTVRGERKTDFRLEGEEQRRRTVIATTSPRASAKVPDTRCILDPGTVYRAELSCSLAWLRSIRPWWGPHERRCAAPGFVHAERTREHLDR